MKKMKVFLAALLLGCIVSTIPVKASATLGEPISNGRISAGQVQKGDTLHYQFTVRNTQVLSPLFSTAKIMRIVWTSEGKQTIVQDIKNRGNGRSYSEELKIEEGMEPGKWKISSILFLDPQKKIPDISEEKGSLRISEQTKDVVADLSFSEFMVKGTKADRKAPTVRTKSMGLTKKRLKNNGKVKFFLKASDKSSLRYEL